MAGLVDGRSSVVNVPELAAIKGMRIGVAALVPGIDPKEIPRKFRRSMSAMSVFATLGLSRCAGTGGTGCRRMRQRPDGRGHRVDHRQPPDHAGVLHGLQHRQQSGTDEIHPVLPHHEPFLRGKRRPGPRHHRPDTCPGFRLFDQLPGRRVWRGNDSHGEAGYHAVRRRRRVSSPYGRHLRYHECCLHPVQRGSRQDTASLRP